jgi:hypothetical protein
MPGGAVRIEGDARKGTEIVDAQREAEPQGTSPLRAVRAARPVNREAAARRVSPRPDVELTRRVHELWDEGVQESREYSRRLAALAGSWMDRESPHTDPQLVEAEDLTVAVALRCTRVQASEAIRQAHRAVHLLGRCMRVLERGEFPAAWFRRLLERTDGFSDAEMLLVDVTVSSWQLGITPEAFFRELGILVAMIEERREEPPSLAPEKRRRMLVDPGRDAGTACLRIIGPAPEIMGLAGRFDAAARAVQDGQRAALRDGTEIPCDPDGQVEREGMPLSLAVIRYHLAQGAALDTDGVTVPAPRFRMNVTVPFLTLMGGGDAPGLLEDGTPIPAPMACELAGESSEWFRVLTDPSSGEFLPVPAQRYRPSPAMLEHIRLRGQSCAVPGCTRGVSVASEADHIIEFDHEDPAAGGATAVENLHMLCWHHHAMKTAGLLDPERVAAEDSPTGRRGTQWSIQDRVRVFREDDTDLLTPETVSELTAVWDMLQRRRAEHGAAADTSTETCAGSAASAAIRAPDDWPPPPPPVVTTVELWPDRSSPGWAAPEVLAHERSLRGDADIETAPPPDRDGPPPF